MKKTDAFVKWTCNFSIYARHIDADMSNDGQVTITAPLRRTKRKQCSCLASQEESNGVLQTLMHRFGLMRRDSHGQHIMSVWYTRNPPHNGHKRLFH
jgi:hypothetical protein